MQEQKPRHEQHKPLETEKPHQDSQIEAGFLRPDQIEAALRAHFENKEVVISHDFKSYDGIAFVTRCEVVQNGEPITVFAYLNLESDIVYRLTPDGTELARSPYKSTSDYDMLKSASETTKVVKSRPPFLYPELMGVEYNELWPKDAKDAKVAVIGDPYMTCDKEGTTIVEYEYGEEMMPPTLDAIVQNTTETLHEKAVNWAKQLHHEDLNALKRIGNPMERPDYGYSERLSGNPYWHAVDGCFQFLASVSDTTAGRENGGYSAETAESLLDYYESDLLPDLRELVQKLIAGTWELRDFENYILNANDSEDQRIAQERLGYYFNIKQRNLEQLGNPEAWGEYLSRWDQYLDRVPVDAVRESMPDIEKRIKQAKHWLSILPEATSPQRVTKAFTELESFYYNLLEWAYQQPEEEVFIPAEQSYVALEDENDSEVPEKSGRTVLRNKYASLLTDFDIADARGTGIMSDGAFGVDVPGHPVTTQTRKFLELALHRAENSITYAREIWPKISMERKRLAQTGVKQSIETERAYLQSFERALVQSYIPLTKPHRAVAVHGFFPDTANIDPQDRIIALTSVTMHGWNHLDRAGFKNNLEASLPFLKKKGRYILGPVNQSIYFGRDDSAFDCNGLTQALQELKEQGLITYRFVKGKRNHQGPDGSDLYTEDRDEPFLEDNQVLLPGESAASLVIEKL